MHKSTKMNALRERNGLHMLVAISLTTFLAGLGACSSNYMPGNGQPTGSTSYGATPHASTYGSSSGTEGTKPQSQLIVAPDVIQPMYSSSSEAIAVLAGHQGRFLGYANPGPASPNYGIDYPTGQVIPPALIANPQQTVNSSISSAPTPVITSGAAGDGGGGVVIGGLSSAATTSGVTAAVTVPGAITAPLFSNAGSLVTATNTAIPATAGVFAAGPGVSAASTSTSTNQNTGLLTPTVTSAITPSPTAAANPPVASAGTAMTTVGNISTPATPTVTNPTTGATVAGSATGTLGVQRPINFPATVAPSATATNASITSPVTVAPATTTTRARAVAQPRAITAPITIPGRVARPVRMTTTSGTVTITKQ